MQKYEFYSNVGLKLFNLKNVHESNFFEKNCLRFFFFFYVILYMFQVLLKGNFYLSRNIMKEHNYFGNAVV